MKYFYRLLSIVFFVASPAALIAAVWYTNWRLFIISFIVMMFSAFASSMAAIYEKNERQAMAYSTVEEMFAALDKKHMDDLEEK